METNIVRVSIFIFFYLINFKYKVKINKFKNIVNPLVYVKHLEKNGET